jgi:dolichol-phosphate mannosyltransferase
MRTVTLGTVVAHLWAERRRVGHWLGVGVAFTLLNIPILYLLVDLLGVTLAVATLIAGEGGLLVRFLVNDRWVFREGRPTWKRVGQYLVAVAGGFVIWWSATIILSWVGVHYLVAALLGTGTSVVWSVVTNFFWVWRHRTPSHSVIAEQSGS